MRAARFSGRGCVRRISLDLLMAWRTADLLRLATGGTGVLRPGAIHPDLVNRPALGGSRNPAHHALTMCVRAIDYCPRSILRSANFTSRRYYR